MTRPRSKERLAQIEGRLAELERPSDPQLDDDLRALATELDDFFGFGRRDATGKVVQSLATLEAYERRFRAGAMLMCWRLHARGWITDAQWDHLRGFDLPVTLPGERVVDVARRFGVIA